MNRADRDIVDRIERAFLETGLRPIQHDWGDGTETGCALTAVFGGCAKRHVTRASRIVGCQCPNMTSGLIAGFDAYPVDWHHDPLEYAWSIDPNWMAAFDSSEVRWSYWRGFRIGWSAAKRVFAPAPTESAKTAVAQTV